MPSASAFDVVVIGAGSAGFAAAEAARAVGASVCLVEKDRLGGECPNWACIPTKALLRAARVARDIKHADAFGATAAANAQIDFKRIMAFRKNAVETITGGGEWGNRYERIAKELSITIQRGQASFVDEHTLDVSGTLVRGKTFVVATGTTEFVPQIPGLSDMRYLTSRDAVGLERQPKSLAIIGGGPVGCELATFFSTIGTRVVLIQAAPTLLPREDAEVARLAQESLTSAGVQVVTGAKILEIINGRGGVYGLRVDADGQESVHAVEYVLLAAGKRANVDHLGLANAGANLDDRGSIITNPQQRTSVKHIFAAGDVDGGMLFTHTAHHEGSIAGTNAAFAALGKTRPPRKRDERVVPRVTFTAPEVASVGMTFAEVKKAHKKVLVGRYAVGALGRAVTDHARFGLVKIVAHPKTRRVLGCHIIGERAGEVIHEAALAIHLNAPIDKIASMIHAFPTYSEGLAAAANHLTIE